MPHNALHDELDDVAESTAARLIGRFLTPVLLLIIGALLSNQLGDIKYAQEQNRVDLSRQSIAIATTGAEVRGISRQLDGIEARVQRLEQLRAREALPEE